MIEMYVRLKSFRMQIVPMAPRSKNGSKHTLNLSFYYEGVLGKCSLLLRGPWPQRSGTPVLND